MKLSGVIGVAGLLAAGAVWARTPPPAPPAADAAPAPAARNPLPPERLCVVTGAEWVRRPSRAERKALHPPGAARRPGQAVLECAIRPDGTLDACGVITEAPAGAGFGQAALALAPMHRMRPNTATGENVGGCSTRLSVNLPG